MIRSLAVGLGLVALTAGPGLAQPGGHAAPPQPFQYHSSAELAAMVAGKAPLILKTLSDHEDHHVLVAGRSGPGEVEVHAHWTDYMAIQQGEALFTYGGAVSGAHATIGGELRGGTITGGRIMTLHPGDFVMVPAGMPHLTSPTAIPFRAIVFKARD